MLQLHFEWMAPALVTLIAAFVVRRRIWAAAVWLPLMAMATWGSLRVLAVVAANNGPDMAALGALFALMFGWPWFVIFLGALFSFPRRWQVVPGIVGGALTAGVAAMFYFMSTAPLTMQVIGTDGKPAAAGFVKSSERDRVKEARTSYATDAAGRFAFRYDPQGLTNFEDGIDGIRFSVQDARKINGRTPEGFVRVQAWWPGIFRSSASYLVPAKEPIPVFLKPANVLVSRPLQDFIRGRLQAAKAGNSSDYESLGGLCANAESFELVPEIAAVIPAQSEARPAAIRALESVAEKLSDLHEFERQIDNRGLIASLDVGQRDLHVAICDWTGVKPTATGAETAPQIYARFQECANQLIAASRPYWGDEDSSVNVVKNLRELGSHALADFPPALAHAQPRGRRMMLFALESRFKDPKDVEWALSSDDPDVVAAAYDGLQDRLPPEECKLAAARLERVSRKGASARAQMQIGYLLPAFRERSRWPAMR